MTLPNPPPKPTELMYRMAAAVGLDLGTEIAQGRLDLTALCKANDNCDRCASPSACDAWLDHSETGDEVSPPGYCSNANFFRMHRVMRDKTSS